MKRRAQTRAISLFETMISVARSASTSGASLNHLENSAAICTALSPCWSFGFEDVAPILLQRASPTAYLKAPFFKMGRWRMRAKNTTLDRFDIRLRAQIRIGSNKFREELLQVPVRHLVVLPAVAAQGKNAVFPMVVSPLSEMAPAKVFS
jgi:hypothetical protein